jgi:hypothetical protein
MQMGCKRLRRTEYTRLITSVLFLKGIDFENADAFSPTVPNRDGESRNSGR